MDNMCGLYRNNGHNGANLFDVLRDRTYHNHHLEVWMDGN